MIRVPVEQGEQSPFLVCSCGLTFSSKVQAIQDFDEGESSLGYATCPSCASTRCWTACARCHRAVAEDRVRCEACSEG
jgi:hypothetical protein